MYSCDELFLRSLKCYFGVNLIPSLLCNSGNKHQNNPLVSTETVRHLSAYIILSIYIMVQWLQPSSMFLSNDDYDASSTFPLKFQLDTFLRIHRW